MDPRTAAYTLRRIGDLLELSGAQRFRVRAYRTAARALLGLDTDDLRTLARSGALADVVGIGPAMLGVITELIEHGESAYLARLKETVPEGLVAVGRIPSLTPAKVRYIHQTLGIHSLEELEHAAATGQLSNVRGFGPKTVARVVQGIAMVRETQGLALLAHATVEATRLAALVGRHPDVMHVDVAGEVRRAMEVVGEINVVACTRANPSAVARDFSDFPAIRHSEYSAPNIASLQFVDGVHLRVACADREQYAGTFWRETGSAHHVSDIQAHATTLGIDITNDNRIIDVYGRQCVIDTERDWYAAMGLEWIPPELREGDREIDAASKGTLPRLITDADITGALHCHSTYSDGTASIIEMADAARARGWQYIGITDHSASAFYAGGLTPDAVRRQHDEIDRLNAQRDGFRILKGIECDILADGSLDYDAELLAQFDYVVGSIHSRFTMDAQTMTRRILTAMEHPRLTVLAHPTGRLLLQRSPYKVDLDAVIETAARTKTVLEFNADGQRLDLDWRWCRVARDRGVLLEIGPDAHSTRGLDNLFLGLRVLRKAWVERDDVLNTRTAAEILAIARGKCS